MVFSGGKTSFHLPLHQLQWSWSSDTFLLISVCVCKLELNTDLSIIAACQLIYVLLQFYISWSCDNGELLAHSNKLLLNIGIDCFIIFIKWMLSVGWFKASMQWRCNFSSSLHTKLSSMSTYQWAKCYFE